jgi:hypothetical protein
MPLLNRILSNLNPLTEYGIAVVSLVGIYFQIRWSRRGIALGPTLLTTLGIFCCFLGIAIGLTDFDPNDVKSSVPHLLQGIRTSFWVSVSGIGWALTIKIRHALFGEVGASSTTAAGGTAAGATVDDLATQLLLLNSAVAGKTDSSVANQLRLSRSDSNDRFDRLARALETHVQATAKANAEALVQILSNVVHDFNSALTVQFGDNFRHLNEGVGRLVTWQVQYERQLQSLIERENAISQTLQEVAGRCRELVDDSTVFVDTATALRSLLGTLNDEREKLADGLTVLAGLVQTAAAGLPGIEKHIVAMTDQVARGVQTNQDMLASVLKSSWQAVQVHNQHLTTILAKSLDAANRETAAHLRQMNELTQTQQVA